MRFPHLSLAVLLACACAPSPRGAAPASETEFPGPLGVVALQTSCRAEAAPALEQGLALLHHMTYEPAEARFAEAARTDPGCAIALWGQAMTYIHPLWSDPPTASRFSAGSTAVARARTLKAAPRERAMIDAVGAYYDAGRGENERTNLAAFDAAWRDAHARYPGDHEITAFFALAHLGTADPQDKTFSHQRAAGKLMEALLQAEPDHPGAHHYLVHAYDAPPLAAGALGAARHYGEVAPDVPHALHMPTHIFTRLGLWDECIAWNLRSARAARAHPVQGHVSLHYLHALDYLAYAYLQTGQDANAVTVADSLVALPPDLMIEIATPYTLAAVPARLALERRRWADAAALPARVPATYPWDRFPAMEALTHFARALGAAHTGDTATASRAIARLDALEQAASGVSPYWATQVRIQAGAARAWAAWTAGDSVTALATMRQAADLESSTEKHPVTPGELLPARELLGDMLLDLGHPAEALDAYEQTLARSPGRLNAVLGAARAAEAAGRMDDAGRYYAEVAELTSDADPDHPAAQAARAWLASR